MTREEFAELRELLQEQQAENARLKMGMAVGLTALMGELTKNGLVSEKSVGKIADFMGFALFRSDGEVVRECPRDYLFDQLAALLDPLQDHPSEAERKTKKNFERRKKS